MRRTNIYLDEEETRLLKHIAVEEGYSFTALVRHALQEFLLRYQQEEKKISAQGEWHQRLENLLARVHRRTRSFSPDEIEADITTAARESRRRRAYAARPR